MSVDTTSAPVKQTDKHRQLWLFSLAGATASLQQVLETILGLTAFTTEDVQERCIGQLLDSFKAINTELDNLKKLHEKERTEC